MSRLGTEASEQALRGYLQFVLGQSPVEQLPQQLFAEPLVRAWPTVIRRTAELRIQLPGMVVVDSVATQRRVDATLETADRMLWRASCIVSPEDARIEGMQIHRIVGDERPFLAGAVIVLNGTSSSGKSTLARLLQDRLQGPWLHVESDAFASMLPTRYRPVPERWGQLRVGTYEAVAALAAAGNNAIFDTVIGGPKARTQLAAALKDVPTCFVGLRCDKTIAEGREAERGDRRPGLVAQQYRLVHEGSRYDIEIDTGRLAADAAADLVVARLGPDSFRLNHPIAVA